MRTFRCPTCEHLVYFENTACLNCATQFGFDPDSREMVPLWDAWTQCRNAIQAACNWVVPADAFGSLCLCCRLTRTRPADDDPAIIAPFAEAEANKRRLVFQLLELGLPIVAYDDTTEHGLAFDLLSSRDYGVTIGHEDGLITLDLAESDDAHRERVRQELGEAYRTMLGHLRHEIGHYYWPLLVEQSGKIEDFRALFGDERTSYDEAMSGHYSGGPPDGWFWSYVSAYATMHPWEDWAETFAHYLHILDTLQTASSFGLQVAARPDPTDHTEGGDADHGFDRIVAEWVPLTFALNAVNRSMGNHDLYPFVLSPKVIEKLAFVDRLVRG